MLSNKKKANKNDVKVVITLLSLPGSRWRQNNENRDDLIEIFNTNNWHWAFYSFREDCWDSMDYELGQEKLSWQYWEAVENGKSLDDFRMDNPLFDVIKTHLGQPNLLRS